MRAALARGEQVAAAAQERLAPRSQPSMPPPSCRRRPTKPRPPPGHRSRPKTRRATRPSAASATPCGTPSAARARARTWIEVLPDGVGLYTSGDPHLDHGGRPPVPITHAEEPGGQPDENEHDRHDIPSRRNRYPNGAAAILNRRARRGNGNRAHRSLPPPLYRFERLARQFFPRARPPARFPDLV